MQPIPMQRHEQVIFHPDERGGTKKMGWFIASVTPGRGSFPPTRQQCLSLLPVGELFLCDQVAVAECRPAS